MNEGHKKRTIAAVKMWRYWYKLYKKGKSIDEIRAMKKNPLTGKPYHRVSIYRGLNKLSKVKI